MLDHWFKIWGSYKYQQRLSNTVFTGNNLFKFHPYPFHSNILQLFGFIVQFISCSVLLLGVSQFSKSTIQFQGSKIRTAWLSSANKSGNSFILIFNTILVIKKRKLHTNYDNPKNPLLAQKMGLSFFFINNLHSLLVQKKSQSIVLCCKPNFRQENKDSTERRSQVLSILYNVCYSIVKY